MVWTIFSLGTPDIIICKLCVWNFCSRHNTKHRYSVFEKREWKLLFEIWIYEESKIIEKRLPYRQIWYGNFRWKGKFWSLCSWIRVFWRSYLFAKYVLIPLSLEKYRDRPKIVCWLHCNAALNAWRSLDQATRLTTGWILGHVLESGFRVSIWSWM